MLAYYVEARVSRGVWFCVVFVLLTVAVDVLCQLINLCLSFGHFAKTREWETYTTAYVIVLVILGYFFAKGYRFSCVLLGITFVPVGCFVLIGSGLSGSYLYFMIALMNIVSAILLFAPVLRKNVNAMIET